MNGRKFYWLLALGLVVALPVLAQAPAEETNPSEPIQVEPLQPAQPAESPEMLEPGDPAETQPVAEPVAETAGTTSEEATAEASSQEPLPKTASPLALLALLGATGVGSALGLRRLRRG